MTISLSPVARPVVPLDDRTLRLLNSRYVGASLLTRNSTYTLLKRMSYKRDEGFVLVVKDGSRNGRSPVDVGDPIVGDRASVEALPYGEEGYVLRVYRDDRCVFQSSRLEWASVFEN